jgi:hypothetical protein
MTSSAPPARSHSPIVQVMFPNLLFAALWAISMLAITYAHLSSVNKS